MDVLHRCMMKRRPARRLQQPKRQPRQRRRRLQPRTPTRPAQAAARREPRRRAQRRRGPVQTIARARCGRCASLTRLDYQAAIFGSIALVQARGCHVRSSTCCLSADCLCTWVHSNNPVRPSCAYAYAASLLHAGGGQRSRPRHLMKCCLLSSRNVGGSCTCCLAHLTTRLTVVHALASASALPAVQPSTPLSEFVHAVLTAQHLIKGSQRVPFLLAKSPRPYDQLVEVPSCCLRKTLTALRCRPCNN